MKVTGFLAVLFLFVGRLRPLLAWDVDPRCPPPILRRALEGHQDDDAERSSYRTNETKTADLHHGRALRGNAERANNIMSRAAIGPNLFSLKMYWELGYCWQEEYSRERKWCWECKEGCKEGGTLWWQKCAADNEDQEFTYLPDSDGGRFKTANHDLCLHRVSTTQYELKECSNDEAQVILGFRSDGKPFELSPLGGPDQCINQDHHPKAGEIVENTTCKIARRWSTNLMELYDAASDLGPDIDNQLRLRDEECSGENPCDHCQGDCDDDHQCRGAELVCFQRTDVNKNSPVPGCKGDAVEDRDYCITRDMAASPPSTPAPATHHGATDGGNQLRLRDEECSSASPCDRCQGDCDDDHQCRGAELVCFQRIDASKDSPVPGCEGDAVTNRDYCIARDMAGSPPSSPAPYMEHSSATEDQLRLRDDECSSANPCDRCQGDCDDDHQCRGAELVCFQRIGNTKDSPVPGCKGDAVTDRDYCVNRDMAAPSPIPPIPAPMSVLNSIPLSTNIRSCSPTLRCNRCEGDCDTDDDCMPGLKCFIKDGPGEISGCIGHDKSKTDYCYLP